MRPRFSNDPKFDLRVSAGDMGENGVGDGENEAKIVTDVSRWLLVRIENCQSIP
jgi:hypothetical protein